GVMLRLLQPNCPAWALENRGVNLGCSLVIIFGARWLRQKVAQLRPVDAAIVFVVKKVFVDPDIAARSCGFGDENPADTEQRQKQHQNLNDSPPVASIRLHVVAAERHECEETAGHSEAGGVEDRG